MYEVALRLGGLTIYWYGVLATLGFFVGIWLASRRALLVKVAGEQVVDLGTWLVLGAIVGARAFYVIYFYPEFAGRGMFWEVFKIWHGGMVFHGGLVGAVAAAFFHLRHRRLPFWRMADIMAPSIALGHSFGRIGCLLKGCCYGKPAGHWWAIHFPEGHVSHGIGVHPTQIYETVLNLGLYLALAWWFRRRHHEGQIFAAYLAGYAVLRAVVELFRGDLETAYGSLLTPGMMISAIILPIGLFLLWRLRTQPVTIPDGPGGRPA